MTFGLFTQMFTPIGRTDRNRFWDQPILSIFHPEGHVSQQLLLIYHRSLSSFSIVVLCRIWKAAFTSWKARVLPAEAPSHVDSVCTGIACGRLLVSCYSQRAGETKAGPRGS